MLFSQEFWKRHLKLQSEVIIACQVILVFAICLPALIEVFVFPLPILPCLIGISISVLPQKVQWWQSKTRPEVNVRHNLATRPRLPPPPPPSSPRPLTLAAIESLLPSLLPPPPLWLIEVLFCLHLSHQSCCLCSRPPPDQNPSSRLPTMHVPRQPRADACKRILMLAIVFAWWKWKVFSPETCCGGGCILGGGRKIPWFIIFMGLHTNALPWGQNLKIGQRWGTPQGRRHAIMSAFYWFPCIARDLACKGGGGWSAIVRGEEVDRRCAFWPKKRWMTWIFCQFDSWFQKIGGKPTKSFFKKFLQTGIEQ